MPVLVNRAKMSTSTTGTGTITLGSAVSGFQTFADAGISDGQTVRYVIEDGANFEIGNGTYGSSGTTLSRSVIESSNSDSAISLSGDAFVFIGAIARDITSDVAITGGNITGITDLALADGGTGASSASAARDNLGLGTGDSPTFSTVNATNIDLNGTLDLDASPNGYLATFNQGAASATNQGISVSIPATAAHDANILLLNGDGEDKFVVKSSGNVEAKGTMTLLNSGDGSAISPYLNLKRDSASPAAWDYLGAVRYLGEDGASAEIPYASLVGRIVDPTAGAEDGRLEIWQRAAGTGTLTHVFDHDKFQLTNEQPIQWYNHGGTSYDVTLAAATPTADRTITLPDATGTVLLSDGDGSNLTNVQAASVNVTESSDDNVYYNILFSDTGNFGTVQMSPTQDDAGITFNPFYNKLINGGVIQAGPRSDDHFIFQGYGADTTSEYVAMGVQTGYASITAGGVGSTSTDLRIRTANSGTETDRVTIKADGKTGFGTTSPSEVIDVVGNIAVSGTVDGKDVSTLTTAAAAADEATALAIALG
jgi:hypothetical protein